MISNFLMNQSKSRLTPYYQKTFTPYVYVHKPQCLLLSMENGNDVIVLFLMTAVGGGQTRSMPQCRCAAA